MQPTSYLITASIYLDLEEACKSTIIEQSTPNQEQSITDRSSTSMYELLIPAIEIKDLRASRFQPHPADEDETKMK